MKLILSLFVLLRLACAQQLRNDAYVVQVNPDQSLTIEARGAPPQRFRPSFLVLMSSGDPQVRMQRLRVEERLETDQYGFPVPFWHGNSNPFEAAESVQLPAPSATPRDGGIRFEYAAHARFRFQAELTLPPGDADPIVRFELAPTVSGWYSVVFTGAPEVQRQAIDFVWQPLVWHERRFPNKPVLTLEHVATTAATLISHHGVTTAVTADPSEIPFRMPVFQNARFGLAARNAAGAAQPTIVAPVLGLPESRMEPGHTFSFRFRIVHRSADWFTVFRHIVRDVHGFGDYRRNATCSLNETVENMIDFAMDDTYSGWVADLRGFDYGTEIAGNTKVASALHPLAAAILTDNEEIYWRRALPTIEYEMSREKFGFSSRAETLDHEGPSHFLRGPAPEAGDLAATFALGLGRSPVFLHYARSCYSGPARELNLRIVSEGNSWPNSLALYRATGDAQYLRAAREGADEYIRRRIETAQADFADVRIERGGQFWSDYFPKWIQLLELYEETREQRYLDAAVRGARLFATVVWTTPVPPQADVIVNPGGKVGLYGGGRKRAPGAVPDPIPPVPVSSPEQKVPAWRVAQAGLAPESAVTCEINPALLLAMHAPYLLRLAHYTGDAFFAELARGAVVGRYASYPGYDINYEFTTVYQRPDYLLRKLGERSYNNVFFNHVWPQLAMLFDYLVADVFHRSKGKVSFPAEHVQAYAYLQARAYGHKAGVFYGEPGVRLWMPRKLCRIDTIQANYIAGYGNGNFYMVLTNQSGENLQAKVTLNPDVIPFDVSTNHTVRIIVDNRPAGKAVLRGGSVEVPLSPKGITAYVIEGLNIKPKFQTAALTPSPALGPASYLTQESPFGRISAMLISGGSSLTSAYLFLEATESQVREAKLHYNTGSGWTALEDARYPFEFSFRVPDQARAVDLRVEMTDTSGNTVESRPMRLEQ